MVGKGFGDKRMPLDHAIRRYVKDGCSLTLGGFCARNSQAAVYEIIRQGKKDLTVIDDSPIDQLDMLIGAGSIRRVEIAWHGTAPFALAQNFRRAMEEGVPHQIEIEEYSNYAAGLRFLAGAMDVPFLPTRSMLGSDLSRYNPSIRIMNDPYGTGQVALVPAANPDVAIIHVQRADIHGNAQIWGTIGNDDNKARAARRTIITCEEIVRDSRILKIPNMTSIPFYCVDAVCEVPFGSHPWFCYGYYYNDLIFFRDYVASAKSREDFRRWLDEWVYGCKDQGEYCKKVGHDRLRRLVQMERHINRIPV